MLALRWIRHARSAWGWWRLPLAAALAVIALALALKVTSTLPPGDGFLYPVERAYHMIGRLAYLPSVGLMACGMMLFLPALVDWGIQRGITRGEREAASARFPLGAVGLWIIVGFTGYAWFGSAANSPAPLDALNSGGQRYYLMRQGSLAHGYTFTLHRCDRYGLVCRPAWTGKNLSQREGWNAGARLAAIEGGVQIHNQGEALLVYRPGEQDPPHP